MYIKENNENRNNNTYRMSGQKKIHIEWGSGEDWLHTGKNNEFPRLKVKKYEPIYIQKMPQFN